MLCWPLRVPAAVPSHHLFLGCSGGAGPDRWRAYLALSGSHHVAVAPCVIAASLPTRAGSTLPYCSPLLHIRWLTSHRGSAGLCGDCRCERGVPLPAALELTGEAGEVGQAHPRVRSAHFSWLTVQNTCLSVIHRHPSAFG